MSSDWLQQGHLTYIQYFQQFLCLKTNPCVLVLTISLTLKEAPTAAEFGTLSTSFQIVQFGTD